jgi:hypothetical protein
MVEQLFSGRDRDRGRGCDRDRDRRVSDRRPGS